MRLIKKRLSISEASTLMGFEQRMIQECIDHEWIDPIEKTGEELDEEDLARLWLIKDLKESFSVNDEGVSIILHLLDQLHQLRRGIRQHIGSLSKD